MRRHARRPSAVAVCSHVGACLFTFAFATVVAGAPNDARAEDLPATLAPPPPAPYHGGPAVEGSLGVYAPTGHLKYLSAPGPWLRVGLGWELGRVFGFFASLDGAFLTTDRAPAPPAPQGYVLWGFGAGVRAAFPIGARVRIPLRAELGMHKADDQGVLGSYGFLDARSFGLSYGATIGVEWRARSRHFGLALEGGIRNDAALKYAPRSDTPLAAIGTVMLRYTL